MFTFIGQKTANAVLLFGGGALGRIQTLVGREPIGRALAEREAAELTKIFHDALDLSLIRLKIGSAGLFSLGGAPFAFCNTIYIPDGFLPAKTDYCYNQAFLQLLAHEATHVWQYQHGGANYMSSSLWHQFAGWRETGSRGAAYAFEASIAAGKTWTELNPEQQARFVETAYAAGFFDAEHKQFVHHSHDFTDFAQQAIRQLRAGSGAP